MKSEIYAQFNLDLAALYNGERDLIANMANFAALYFQRFQTHWVGFYRVDVSGNLILGPFQGPVACTRIEIGKGVCGKSLFDKKTIIVDDVHQFSGHIACSALSNSEIVVPLIIKNNVIAVLDIDSITYSNFDQVDAAALENSMLILANSIL